MFYFVGSSDHLSWWYKPTTREAATQKARECSENGQAHVVYSVNADTEEEAHAIVNRFIWDEDVTGLGVEGVYVDGVRFVCAETAEVAQN